MRLDDREGPGPSTDPNDALDGVPLDQEGGSAVLERVMRVSTAAFAVKARQGLEVLVVPHIVGLLEANRANINVIMLLTRSSNDVELAAEKVLTENGVPDAMRDWGVRLSREGQGLSLNYGPAVDAVVSAVKGHLHIEDDDEADDE
ncbi:MAG TPA: hypothetical protein PKV72_02670 [Candidatus Peribacteria bacterium]|nr:hypothetical protein [Candidatus Peribacteria bacterium]